MIETAILVPARAKEGEEKEEEEKMIKEEEMVGSGGYSIGLSRPTNSDSKACLLLRKIFRKRFYLKLFLC